MLRIRSQHGSQVETNSANRQEQFKASKEVSVMAWIENQFGDVLLLKQVRGNKSWTLPGGKVRVARDRSRRPCAEKSTRKLTEDSARGSS